MTSYLFVFGRTPALSALELGAFTPSYTPLGSSVALVSDDMLSIPVHDACQVLGGTVKIARVLGSVPTLTPETLIRYFPQQSGRITYGMSVYNSDTPVPRETLTRVKELLEERGVTARYVTAKGAALSAVVIEKQHVHELILVFTDGKWTVGQTIGVQAFEAWSKRDYGRPHFDAKGGMLPPKVARMIVNIALGSPAAGKVLYDPFCGMGTILSEAVLRGADILGSDQSDDIVVKARANVAWLVRQHGTLAFQPEQIFVCDATHASSVVRRGSVDVIVTEPFMGSTAIAHNRQGTERISVNVKDVIRGLEKLYIGCLKDWHSVLKDGGLVIIALPLYAVGGREYFVKRVIDTLDRLGYTTVVGPIEYSRPQAVVRRRFFVFRKIIDEVMSS